MEISRCESHKYSVQWYGTLINYNSFQLRNTPMQRSCEEIQRLLEGVGLPKDEDPLVGTLSHCKKRKLSLILALIGNAKVMSMETALSEVWVQVHLLRAHARTHARTHTV